MKQRIQPPTKRCKELALRSTIESRCSAIRKPFYFTLTCIPIYFKISLWPLRPSYQICPLYEPPSSLRVVQSRYEGPYRSTANLPDSFQCEEYLETEPAKLPFEGKHPLLTSNYKIFSYLKSLARTCGLRLAISRILQVSLRASGLIQRMMLSRSSDSVLLVHSYFLFLRERVWCIHCTPPSITMTNKCTTVKHYNVASL